MAQLPALIRLLYADGTAPRFVTIINWSVSALILVMCALVVRGEAAVHAAVMVFLGLGLLASLNW